MLPRFLKRHRRDHAIAAALYGAIVAQARHPALYADLGVPDTLEGRFEMIVLHLALVLRHLRADEAQQAVGQEVFDAFCADMDRSLREMGVGDLGVGKRMRKMAEAFYGRAGNYDRGLAAGDRAEVAATLGRSVFDEANEPRAAVLANYVLAADAALSGLPAGSLMRSPIDWPDPAQAAKAGVTP